MAREQAVERPEDFVDELKPGTKLLQGQYTIVQFINAGGFGITYLAKNSLDREVVIKECFPGSFCRRTEMSVSARSRAHESEFAQIVKLFVQEAKSLAKLIHPNIVGVHQVFEDNDTAYMAIDFIDGRDMLDIIESDRDALKPQQTVTMLRKLLGAVAFIHDNGMLHRDISPDNILISKDGEPILIDFGAARQQATKIGGKALSALRVVKDGYSPQEFYISGSVQNASSDLYALAASFYHAISGDVPPSSQERLVSIAEKGHDPYMPLAGRIDGYPDGFLEAIDTAINVLPRDRLQSAREWLERIGSKPALKVVPLGTRSEPVPNARLGGKPRGKPKPGAAPAAAPQADVAQSAAAREAARETAWAEIVAETVERGGSGSRLRLMLGMVAVAAGLAGYGYMKLAPPPEAEAAAVAARPAEPEATVATAEPAAEPAAESAPGPEIPAVPAETEALAAAEDASELTVAATDITPAHSRAPEILTAPAEPEAPVAAEPEQAADSPATIVAAPPELAPEPAAPDPAIAEPGSAELAFTAPASPEPQAPASTATPAIVAPEAPEPEPAAGAPAPAVTAAEIAPSGDAAVAFRQIKSIRWDIELPFDLDTSGRFPVISAVRAAPETLAEGPWISEGVSIYAINGTFVSDRLGVERMIAAAAELGNDRYVYTSFRIRPAPGEPLREVMLPVLATRRLSLVTGEEFRIEAIEGTWRISVIDVAAQAENGLRTGDVLLAERSTGMPLDGGAVALQSAIDSLARDNHAAAVFTVLRDGVETSAELPLARER